METRHNHTTEPSITPIATLYVVALLLAGFALLGPMVLGHSGAALSASLAAGVAALSAALFGVRKATRSVKHFDHS